MEYFKLESVINALYGLCSPGYYVIKFVSCFSLLSLRFLSCPSFFAWWKKWTLWRPGSCNIVALDAWVVRSEFYSSDSTSCRNWNKLLPWNSDHQKTQACISGISTPLVDPCTCSSAVFGDFVPLGYQDWSEDIVKPRCGVHKAQGSVAVTEKKRCWKGRYFPPLVGPLPSAILKDFSLPCPVQTRWATSCGVSITCCAIAYTYTALMSGQLQVVQEAYHPGLESDPETQSIDKSKILVTPLSLRFQS